MDPVGQRIFISDSANNRILIVKYNGDVEDCLGDFNGKSGLKDGEYAESLFHFPIGLCYHKEENSLYVADSENHAIRKINLNKRNAETVLGNGTRGNDRVGGKSGANQLLSTPYDIVVDPSTNNLYFSMSGMHQVR